MDNGISGIAGASNRLHRCNMYDVFACGCCITGTGTGTGTGKGSSVSVYEDS